MSDTSHPSHIDEVGQSVTTIDSPPADSSSPPASGVEKVVVVKSTGHVDLVVPYDSRAEAIRSLNLGANRRAPTVASDR